MKTCFLQSILKEKKKQFEVLTVCLYFENSNYKEDRGFAEGTRTFVRIIEVFGLQRFG